MAKYILGIDIGGTKISVCLALKTGKILEKQVLRTQIRAQTWESVSGISNAILNILAQRKIFFRDLLGIGVGIPGPLNFRKEKIERSPNLPGWERVPLKKILNRLFKCPVFIENDAKAATLGIKYFGEGRSVDHFVYITVSTGIGSGMIINRQLVRGIIGAAGEIGHTTIEIGGEQCPCGKLGCLEAYASGTAIAKFARRALRKGNRSKILQYCAGVAKVSGAAVSQAAHKGDVLAIQIRHRAADYLGVAIGNIINTLNPERIVLGGGVLEQTTHFWQPMMKAIRREAWPLLFKSCKIVKTRLANRVGDFGTIAVVLERLSLRE